MANDNVSAVLSMKGGNGSGGSGTDSNAVHYSADTKAAAERAAALANVGGEPEKMIVDISLTGGVLVGNKTQSEITEAYNDAKDVVVRWDEEYFTLIWSDGDEFWWSSITNLLGDRECTVVSLTSNGWDSSTLVLGQAPIHIICTMTSASGGTWSGTTFAELQAACAAGRLLNAYVVGVANVTAFMKDASDGTAILTSPFILPSAQYGVVILSENGTFAINWLVTPDPHIVTNIVSTNVTLDAYANNIYEYGELTSLTVTTNDNPGDFIIRFTSGSTATTTSFPVSMKFPTAFAAEANTRYEINVSNGYALVASWPVS